MTRKHGQGIDRAFGRAQQRVLDGLETLVKHLKMIVVRVRLFRASLDRVHRQDAHHLFVGGVIGHRHGHVVVFQHQLALVRVFHLKVVAQVAMACGQAQQAGRQGGQKRQTHGTVVP